MTLIELLRAYPDDPTAIMSKRFVNVLADYIEELEAKIKTLEQENERTNYSRTSDNSNS